MDGQFLLGFLEGGFCLLAMGNIRGSPGGADDLAQLVPDQDPIETQKYRGPILAAMLSFVGKNRLPRLQAIEHLAIFERLFRVHKLKKESPQHLVGCISVNLLGRLVDKGPAALPIQGPN